MKEKRATPVSPPADDPRTLWLVSYHGGKGDTFELPEAKGSYIQAEVAQVVTNTTAGGQPPRGYVRSRVG